MNKFFKAALAAAAAAVVSCTAFAAGCTVSLGADGRDGQDVSIYEIWEAVKTETNNPDLTFQQFIKEYLNYDGSELEQITSLQSAINRSLLSAVQVTAEFTVMQYGRQSVSVSFGSGVIIEADKQAGDMYVVTNAHVVFNNNAVGSRYSNKVNIYLYGREYTLYYMSDDSVDIDDAYAIPAQIIGASLTYDIAVLKVSGSDAVSSSSVMPAEWAQGENAVVGQSVYAIGNAASDGLSATNGIISVGSEDVTLDMYDTPSNYSDDFTYRTIRTNVPVYSGNSGGGLFDADGRLVGIINSKTVAANDGEYSDNISHALPAANCRRVVESLIYAYENGLTCSNFGIEKAVLGVTVQSQSSGSHMNNQTNVVEIIESIIVADISADSIARDYLKRNDVVTNIKITDRDGVIKEDADVTRLYTLGEVMLSAREGDTVTVTVNRVGEENPVSFPLTITSGCFSHYV